MGPSYRGNVEGSDPGYSFHHIGTNDTLYVFEAPIDMLSNITLYPEGWRQNSYVALDGVTEHAMLRLLVLNSHLKRVVLCLDHDEAGIEAAGRLSEILREQGYRDVPVWQPDCKDWNEDLKAKHGVTPLPAQEHPKLESLSIICRELDDMCNKYPSGCSLDTVLQENYEKLKPLLSGKKISLEVAPGVTEHLMNMAAAALLSAQRQYRQMENPVTAGQLLVRLQNSYRPHQDRGRLRSKADDLRQDMVEINHQRNAEGIRSQEDKRRFLSSYLRLALDCVRAQIFVCLQDYDQMPEESCRQDTGESVQEQSESTHISIQQCM